MSRILAVAVNQIACTYNTKLSKFTYNNYPIEYRYILINIYFSIVGLETFSILKKMVYIGVNFFWICYPVSCKRISAVHTTI